MAAKQKKDPPKVLDHQLRTTSIADLKPHPDNKRRHADSVIDESIETNGIYKPVTASSASGFMLTGHGTVERARAAGLKEIPVYWIDGLTPAEERKILLADNRSAALGSDDPFSLMGMLEDLDGDFLGTGFTGADLDALRDDPSLGAWDTPGEAGDGEGGSNKGTRTNSQVGQKKASTGHVGKAQVKCVLFVDEVGLFERALKLTRERNRGAALMKICAAYVGTDAWGEEDEDG